MIALLVFKVLKTLRMVVPKVPILRNVLPAFSYVPDSSRPPVPPSIPPVTNPICVTRTICSGLMYPSLAAFLGWALYSGTAPESQLKRTLLGKFRVQTPHCVGPFTSIFRPEPVFSSMSEFSRA